MDLSCIGHSVYHTELYGGNNGLKDNVQCETYSEFHHLDHSAIKTVCSM